MSIKKRIQNLESQPEKHVDAPKETALQFAIRWREERRKEIAADPDAWERGAEAREQARLKHLQRLGFPDGYSPTWREHLQRLVEQKLNHAGSVAGKGRRSS